MKPQAVTTPLGLIPASYFYSPLMQTFHFHASHTFQLTLYIEFCLVIFLKATISSLIAAFDTPNLLHWEVL